MMSDLPASDPQSGADSAMDDWAAALAEQTAASAPPPKQVTQADTAMALFQPLQGDNGVATLDMDALKSVPVQLSVELGRTRLTIKELLQLGQGSVVELDGLAGEPLDILINGFLIAQGEVVVVGDSYGVRLTDIMSPSERLARLTKTR